MRCSGAFSSSFESLISLDSTLIIENGVTFEYNPSIANRDLIKMAGPSSTLHLNGCTLKSTETGMRLSSGKILFDNLVTLSAEGQTQNEAISFGSDLCGCIVEVLGGAEVDCYGYIDIK